MKVTDKIQITNEDNMALMSRYEDNYFDLAIVDPPYGIDINSSKFAPYSTSYLKKLNREGKKTAVDLFYTGRMLGALTPSGKTVRKTGKHKISLGFSNAQMRQRALFNQVLNEPKRVFFGFNDRTEKIIQNTFNKFIKKQFRDMKL